MKERDAEARDLFERAYSAQMAGRLDEAVRLYRRSIDLHPTAEAHTFLGWTYSFQKRYDDAIEECRRAIEVDPEFGNPYNDIGAYLVELGRPDEAVPWLEKAKTAARYEPRQFPFINLARVYIELGRLHDAVRELEGALEIDPAGETALALLRRVEARLN